MGQCSGFVTVTMPSVASSSSSSSSQQQQQPAAATRGQLKHVAAAQEHLSCMYSNWFCSYGGCSCTCTDYGAAAGGSTAAAAGACAATAALPTWVWLLVYVLAMFASWLSTRGSLASL